MNRLVLALAALFGRLLGHFDNLRLRWRTWRVQRMLDRRRIELDYLQRYVADPPRKSTPAAFEKVWMRLYRLRRWFMMHAATVAFIEGDRLRPGKGGMVWWPALAPLTPAERAIVRRNLGLNTHYRESVERARRERYAFVKSN